jgi:hypothetical protein
MTNREIYAIQRMVRAYGPRLVLDAIAVECRRIAAVTTSVDRVRPNYLAVAEAIDGVLDMPPAETTEPASGAG